MKAPATAVCRIAALLAALLVYGCGRAERLIADTAEKGRDATEHFAAASKAASDDREEQVTSKAAAVSEGEAVALGERFYMRAEGTGWAVMDRSSGGIATVRGEPMDSLTLEDAQRMLEMLRADDDDKP